MKDRIKTRDGNWRTPQHSTTLKGVPLDKDITQFQGKKVILVKKLDEPDSEGNTLVEVEGEAMEANPSVGLFFRPRGKTMGGLVKLDELEDIRLAPITLKPVKVKGLKNMTLDTVRQHLADRHGFSVELLGTTNEEQAAKIHNDLHAATKDLAHNHGDPGMQSTD